MKSSIVKKSFNLVILMFLTISINSSSNNLLLCGNLEDIDSDELNDYFYPSQQYGRAECSLYQEEDGNRCLKVTILDYHYYGSSTHPYIDVQLLMGGDGIEDPNKPSSPSILVEPNTTYEFGFDISGTVTTLLQNAGEKTFFYGWDKKKNRRSIMPILEHPEQIEGRLHWARYTGEFTTFEDTYSCSLRLLFWGDGLDYTPGTECYILLDNIYVRKKEAFASTPTGFSAVRNNGYGEVILSWNFAEHAQQYLIYRNDGQEPFAIVEDPTITIWIDKTAEAEQSYSYKISSRNHNGESEPTPYIDVERMGYIKGIIKGLVNDESQFVEGAYISSNTGLVDIHSHADGSFLLGPLVLGEYFLEIRTPFYKKKDLMI